MGARPSYRIYVCIMLPFRALELVARGFAFSYIKHVTNQFRIFILVAELVSSHGLRHPLRTTRIHIYPEDLFIGFAANV